LSGIGRFLEISVRSQDVVESLLWYKTLGFHELETADVYPHKYAVVSDGVLCIGIHDREMDSPAITFVQPDLARHARSMADHGFEFSFMHLGEERFNEIGVNDHDRHLITIVEARTFHGNDENDNDSACGTWSTPAVSPSGCPRALRSRVRRCASSARTKRRSNTC
jgi:hypothetical protein